MVKEGDEVIMVRDDLAVHPAGGGGVVPGTIIEDYEDKDWSEWNGITSSWTFDESNVFHGNVAVSTNQEENQLISTGGLNAYPRPGSDFAVQNYLTDNDHHINNDFGVVDFDKHYSIQIDYASGAFENVFILWRSDGPNSSTALDNASIPVTLDEWLEVQVSWGLNGLIECELFDSTGSSMATVSATDTTYSAEGIGMSLSQPGSTPAYWDYWRFI